MGIFNNAGRRLKCSLQSKRFRFLPFERAEIGTTPKKQNKTVKTTLLFQFPETLAGPCYTGYIFDNKVLKKK